MSETWEQTKARLKRNGIASLKPERPAPNYEEIPEDVPLYEIRKLTLPVNRAFEHGKVAVYGVTAAEADWWIDYKLKPRVYQDAVTDMKTLVFFEKFLIGGTPKERNIYSNPAKFCTEEFPQFKSPRRVN